MSDTLNQFREARATLKFKTDEVNVQLREELAQRRRELVSEEYDVLALLAQRAVDEGHTITSLCHAYGTRSRRTIMDLLDHIVTDLSYTPPGTTKAIHEYFDVERLEDGRVTISSNEPVPIHVWEVARPSHMWEGSLTTDGVISDDYGPLWEELRQTNLPFMLGIREIFEL